MATKRLQVVLTGRDDGAGEVFDDVGDSAGGLEGKLSGLGTALAGAALAAGAAIGAALYTGISTALDQQAGTGMLQAQLGLSDEEAARAGQTAGDVYANNFGESLEETRAAVGAVWSTLGESLGPGEDALQRVTEQALTFSKVFGLDVEQAAGLAGEAIEDGLARDATHAFDLMTAASQEMPAAMRAELVPAISEYGGFLAELGFTGEEAFGLLADASRDGMYGIDKTGDALKELTIRATDMSAASTDAYAAMGLDAEEMAGKILAGGDTAKEGFDQIIDGLLGIEDPVAQSNAAIALFGTPLEDLGTSEIPAFLQSLDDVEAGLGDVTGATDTAAAQTNRGLGAWVEGLKRQGIMLLSNFFTDIAAAFEEGGIDGVVDHLGNVWDEAWPVVQAKASELFDRLGVWLETEGPVVAAKIGRGILAAGEWLVTNWPIFAAKMLEFWGRIGTWITETGIPALGDWLKQAGPALWQWIQDAWPPFARKMAEFWARLGVWIATTAIPWLLQKGAELWAAMFEWLWTEAVPALLRGVGSLISALGGWFTGTAIPFLRRKAGEWFGWLVTQAQDKGGAALEWLRGLPGRIGSWITGTAAPALRRQATTWFGRIREAAVERAGALIDYVRGIPGRILRAIGDLGTKLLRAGRELIQGLIDGIRDKIPSLDGVLGGITDRIPDWKGPPERDEVLLRPAGESIMDGLLDGIAAGERDLWAKLGAITRAMQLDADVDLATPAGSTLRGATSAAAATGSGRGGDTVVVNLRVAGHVLTEHQLVEFVQSGLLRKQRRSSSPILPGVS